MSMNQPQQPAPPQQRQEAAPQNATPRPEGPGAYRDTEQDALVRSNDTVHMNQEEKDLLEAEEKREMEEFKKRTGINDVHNEVLRLNEKPDRKKMLETLDNLHPRRVEKGKLVPYTCCNTCGGFSIGCNFCFCGTEKPSPEVIKYGPAFTQYFRQVKSSIFFTIWCALLLTLLVWFYSEAYKVSTSKDQSANEVDGASVFLELRDWTLSASLGGYASSSAQFYEANFTNISTLDSSTNRITGNDNPNSIGLTCVLGSLDVSPTFTYYGLIPKRFPASYTFYMYVKSENNATNFYNAISSCEGQKKCTVAYNSNWFQGAAEDYISGKQGGEAHKFYLKYRCKDIELTYFGKTLKKETLNALIIIIYVVLLISFLGYLWAWSHFEDKIFSFFRDHHPLPSDYTIKLKELPQNLSEPEFKESLLKHFQAFHKSVGVRPDAIVDIQVAKNNEIMYYDAKLKKLNTELQNIIEMLVNEKTIPRPEEGKPLDVDYVKTYFNQHPANFKEKVAKRRIENFFELLTKKQRNDLKRQEKGKNQSKFESAFITFDYHQSKVKVFNKMNISKWQRWTSGCSDKASINKFEGKVLRVEQACEPDNINWHNLQTSGCQKFMRRMLSWTLTIALVAVPLVIVILISRSLKDTEPLKLNCPPSGTFSKEVISSNSDSSKAIRLALVKDYESPNSENLMFCYCFESFRERFNQEFPEKFSDGTSKKVCQDVYYSIAKQAGLSILMAGLLSACSIVIDILLQALSTFEKYSNTNDEYESRIFKGFLLRYIMTCALTMFINLRLRLGSEAYLGDFDDFTPNWFKNIGYSLGMTFFIKILATIFMAILQISIVKIRRCFDTCCLKAPEFTKQITQRDFVEIYKNPNFTLDFSYTELINTMFVMMTLAPLLPYIAYIGIVYLLVLYWKDKMMFLLFSRKPPQFDEKMSQTSRKITSLAIPVFLIICIWVFGNSQLLEETDVGNSYAAQVQNTVSDKTLSYQGFFGPLITFFNRCINTNAIIFFILLMLYVLYLLLKLFFGGLTLFFIDLLCSCCQKKDDAQTKKDLAQVHFCWRVPRNQCLEEFEVNNSKVGQKFQIDAQLSELRTKQYRRAHAAMMKSQNRHHSHQMFVTLHSYDYRLNPDLIYLFRDT